MQHMYPPTHFFQRGPFCHLLQNHCFMNTPGINALIMLGILGAIQICQSGTKSSTHASLGDICHIRITAVNLAPKRHSSMYLAKDQCRERMESKQESKTTIQEGKGDNRATSPLRVRNRTGMQSTFQNGQKQWGG